MQTITPTYEAHAKANIRQIEQIVEFDWFDDGVYVDESQYVQQIEVERMISEPFGGITSALADIRLINHRDRYTLLG